MMAQFTNPAINYYVDDVERAVDFYISNFGFVETFRTPKQGKPIHVEVKLNQFILGLASKESGEEMHGLQLRGQGIPKAELVLWTDDVDRAYKELLDKGIASISPPHTFLGSLRSTWIMDPDGNPIQIVTKVNG